jgi:hypothetical protein
MVGKKWDNVDRTVLRGSLTERNLARICAQKRAFLLPARSQLQKDNSHCHGNRRLAGKMPISRQPEVSLMFSATRPCECCLPRIPRRAARLPQRQGRRVSRSAGTREQQQPGAVRIVSCSKATGDFWLTKLLPFASLGGSARQSWAL